MPTTAGNPLRVSDLVPLRRMLGTDSIVIRVHEDGTLAPLTRLPPFCFDRAIREVLTNDVDRRFDDACRQAVAGRSTVAFQPEDATGAVVMINPILDDTSGDCRFLVCWVRKLNAPAAENGGIAWVDLRLDDVISRYRRRPDLGTDVVEASPWWVLENGELLELWQHHSHVSAMGLGHAVMEALITDAAEAAAGHGGGPAVRIVIPSADMLVGLIPVVHGALRASGLNASRMVAAIDVDLAVDPDLLPIVVHLRTMGIGIDIVGLDELTNALHRINATTAPAPTRRPSSTDDVGAWVATLDEVIGQST